jgi:hypothetical protein
VPRLDGESRVLWFNLPDPTHFGIYSADHRPLNVTQELRIAFHMLALAR